MLYAKIAEDGSVLKWPVSEPILRRVLSNITLPEVITNEDLINTGYITIPPLKNVDLQETATKRLKMSDSLIKTEEGYIRQYELIDINDDSKIDKRINDKWKKVRKQRDILMKRFDWRILRHQREVRLGLVTTEDITILDNYMNLLANITEIDDPFLIVWPDVPELP